MATYVYIDGLNFYYGAVRNTTYKWVDFEALVRSLLPRDTIGRIRYFSAIVKPRYAGDKSHERQNTLFRALRANPLIEVHEGHFRVDDKWKGLATAQFGDDVFRPHLRPRWLARAIMSDATRRLTSPLIKARVLVDEEKASDVNLGSYLVYDVLKGVCTKALVISNDSDLESPIRLAVAEGIDVGFMNPHRGPTSRRLRNAATFEIKFRPQVLAKCQMPRTVRDRRGRQIHKPKEW